MSSDGARRFLDSIQGHRFDALFVTATMTGLRSGELRGLTWDDVDLETRAVTVRRSLQRIAGESELVEPKSRAGLRTIPLTELTTATLRTHKIATREARLMLGPDWIGAPWDLIFTTSVGTPLDAANVIHAFHAALASAGLPRQRFHDMRHGVATFMLEAGVPARVVADVLSHSQVSMTLSVYSHVMPTLRRDAADRMEAILGV